MRAKLVAMAVVSVLVLAATLWPACPTARAGGGEVVVTGLVWAKLATGGKQILSEGTVKFDRVGSAYSRVTHLDDGHRYTAVLPVSDYYVTVTSPGYITYESKPMIIQVRDGAMLQRDFVLTKSTPGAKLTDGLVHKLLGERVEVTGPLQGTVIMDQGTLHITWKTAVSPPFRFRLVNAATNQTVADLGTAQGVADSKTLFHQDWLLDGGMGLATAWYRVRVSARNAAGVEDGASGDSPGFSYHRPTDKHLVTLNAVTTDRDGWKGESYNTTNLPTPHTAVPDPSKKDLARVGFYNGKHYEKGPPWGCWWYQGWVYRSQITFPSFAMLKSRVKQGCRAWLFFKVVKIGAGGPDGNLYKAKCAAGPLFALSAPWTGPVMDQPGVLLQNLSTAAGEFTVDVTPTVTGWLQGKPNFGFVIGACDEKFTQVNTSLVSYVKVTLNVEYRAEEGPQKVIHLGK